MYNWGHQIKLSEMLRLINSSRKRSERNNGKGRITINTLPEEVMERANRELILYELK